MLFLSVLLIGCNQNTESSNTKYSVLSVYDFSANKQQTNIEELEYFDEIEQAMLYGADEDGYKAKNIKK